MGNIKFDIDSLFSLSNNKKYLNEQKKIINDKCEKIDIRISIFMNDNNVKSFINNKLEEGIEKFNLNIIKGKEKEQTHTVKWESSSTGKESESGEYEQINPRSEFIPSKDKWELINIEKNDKGQYKITVDNVKGRQYIGAFNWITDEYYTDWFEINDILNKGKLN